MKKREFTVLSDSTKLKLDMKRQCPCGRVGVVVGTIYCVDCLGKKADEQQIKKNLKEQTKLFKSFPQTQS